MGLRRVVVRSTGSRNGVPVYYKGTQALPKKQSGSIGKARPEQNAVCVSDMEANGLHNKLSMLLALLSHEAEVMGIEREIQDKVKLQIAASELSFFPEPWRWRFWTRKNSRTK